MTGQMLELISTGSTTAAAVILTFVLVEVQNLKKAIEELKADFKNHVAEKK